LDLQGIKAILERAEKLWHIGVFDRFAGIISN
jgi:hypothetical protein